MPAQRKMTLADRVRQRVKDAPPPHKCWFDRLDDEHRAEMLEIKRAWMAGELKIAAIRLAEYISDVLKEAGVVEIGYQGVINWLKNKNRD